MRTKFGYLLLLTALLHLLPARGDGLNANIKAAEPKATQFLTVTMASGSSVQATNHTTQYTTATFYGYAATSATATPTANAASVAIGFATQNADGTRSATNLVDTVPAGSFVKITAPPGTKYDLADVFLNGTTSDKVVIMFEQ